MGQTLLFPDPKPLDRRLGRNFFRRAPRRPGVYLMRDAADQVLYVGKAKDLKQRLSHYRLANPDRMPRRHLRLVREVARIEFQFCANESAALRQESKLLRSLKPRFNRAGVWPGKTRFIAWRLTGEKLELAVAEIPEPGWRRFGPLGSSAGALHQSLSRLLWLVLNPRASVAELPVGWVNGRFPDAAQFRCSDQAEDILAGLEKFFWGEPQDFLAWLGSSLSERTHSFERTMINTDVETFQDFSVKRKVQKPDARQLALL
jgi:excinuclease UvrABC nuclease subunit